MVLSLNDLGDIRIKDEDIVTILANLLDNAIEACEKVTEGSRSIKFKFLLEDKITISVKNPMKGKIKIVDNYPMSTKQNWSGHGIGMHNIEMAVKKYNGEVNYSSYDGFFTYTIHI
jgi:sensor histidine kinase regulating citrate/malate metabolism